MLGHTKMWIIFVFIIISTLAQIHSYIKTSLQIAEAYDNHCSDENTIRLSPILGGRIRSFGSSEQDLTILVWHFDTLVIIPHQDVSVDN